MILNSFLDPLWFNTDVTLCGGSAALLQKLSKPCWRRSICKKSIPARALRDELGTNNPTEESALELLKSLL